MSAYTTLNITDGKAKAYIMQAMLSGCLSNGDLESMLEVLACRKLYNINIVSDGSSNDNAELGEP